MTCEFYYGTSGYCPEEAVETVTHDDPTCPYANPHIEKTRGLDIPNEPGQMRVEHYCSSHAEEVRRYWAWVQRSETRK